MLSLSTAALTIIELDPVIAEEKPRLSASSVSLKDGL